MVDMLYLGYWSDSDRISRRVIVGSEKWYESEWGGIYDLFIWDIFKHLLCTTNCFRY